MLTEDLKQLIRNQYREYRFYRKVASLTGVSDKTVRNVVLGLYVDAKKRPGPKPEITRRETRSIARTSARSSAAGERDTAPKLLQECGLQRVSTRTVQRKLCSMGQTYKKAKKTIILSQVHKQARLDRARVWIQESMDWTKVIWTDEKRFNSDGLYSWSSWMPNGKPLQRNKRQQGGPSIQVWGALVPGPTLVVFELPKRGDSKDFMLFIEEQVVPVLTDVGPRDFVFQQDRAATHTSAHSRNRFDQLGTKLLDWPSRSPDLNPIENC